MTSLPQIKNRFRPIPSGRSGMALLISMLVILVMAVLAVPFLFKVAGNERLTEKDFRETAAVNLAEAGVERAIWELNKGTISSWTGTAAERTLSLSNVQTAQGLTVGDVAISVSGPETDFPVVTAVGRVAWTGGQSVEKTVRAVLKHGFESFFDFGIFGDEGFDLHGNAYTDSYNSEIAPYNALQPGARGDVGTNAFNNWEVVLLNNTIVNGNAVTGPNSDPEYVIRLGNAAEITGEKSALTLPKPLPAYPAPFLDPRGAFATATGSTDTVITQSGTYSSFDLAANSKVTIQGKVTLFVDGDFLMNANSTIEIAPGSEVEIVLGNGTFRQDSNTAINNLTQNPRALALLGTADFHTMVWRSNSQFYGVVYVPEADIDYSANGDFFGSVVCNNLTISSETGIHYDESLGAWDKYGTTSTDFIVKSWQER